MSSGLKAEERLSRRKWTANLVLTVAGAAGTASAVAVPAVAQSNPPTVEKTPPQGAPAAAPSAATPEQKLQKAYADIRAMSERLAKIEVPMDTEPAFAFRP